MKVIEISKEKTPEKFYSRFDEESQAWIETEVFPAADLKLIFTIALRLLCFESYRP